ncbi:MAG: hypothetical protein GY952_17385 [Rhodobacteraceae bacterium]|nr:hypothetical protein [Paracoccaceae bacterium]
MLLFIHPRGPQTTFLDMFCTVKSGHTGAWPVYFAQLKLTGLSAFFENKNNRAYENAATHNKRKNASGTHGESVGAFAETNNSEVRPC